MTKLLPWEQTDDNNWTARTKIDDYHVWMCDFRGECNLIFEASHGSEWRTGLGTHPTLDLAIAACESDYVSRCTEFLRVAGAGEIIVTRAAVYPIVKVVCGGCGFAGSMSNPRCAQDCFYRPLYDQFKAQTAAIDAAGGGR